MLRLLLLTTHMHKECVSERTINPSSSSFTTTHIHTYTHTICTRHYKLVMLKLFKSESQCSNLSDRISCQSTLMPARWVMLSGIIQDRSVLNQGELAVCLSLLRMSGSFSEMLFVKERHFGLFLCPYSFNVPQMVVVTRVFRWLAGCKRQWTQPQIHNFHSPLSLTESVAFSSGCFLTEAWEHCCQLIHDT